MDVNLEDPPLRCAAEVTNPATQNNGDSDIASFRWERLGGHTPADIDFRAVLYRRIGAVTVAGGHAEAAMKRVILSAEERGEEFADVDLAWSGLIKRLDRVAASSHTVAGPLRGILTWAEREKVKKRRDDVVHAYWWHWAGVNVTRSRFTRDGQSYMLGANLEALERDAEIVFEFARRLDDLVLRVWPQARLLPDGHEPSAFVMPPSPMEPGH